MCPMGKTVQVAADRAYDQSRTVLPAEVARGTYMQNPPGLAALKLMHLLIAKAGGRMGEDVEHRVRLSEVRGVEGLRNHDRASLAPLFAELQAAVLIHDDTEKKRLTIGGLLDIAEVDYRDELSGDLVISWYFSRMLPVLPRPRTTGRSLIARRYFTWAASTRCCCSSTSPVWPSWIRLPARPSPWPSCGPFSG